MYNSQLTQEQKKSLKVRVQLCNEGVYSANEFWRLSMMMTGLTQQEVSKELDLLNL